MHPDRSDDHIKKLIMLAIAEHKNEFKFSKEINLGHVIITLTALATAFGMYLSFHDHAINNEARIEKVEVGQLKLDKTVDQISNNQTAIAKTLDHLSWIVESQMEKKK